MEDIGAAITETQAEDTLRLEEQSEARSTVNTELRAAMVAVRRAITAAEKLDGHAVTWALEEAYQDLMFAFKHV